MTARPDERPRDEAAASVDAVLARHLPALRAFVRLRAGPAIRARESESDIVQSVCRELLAERSRFEFQGEGAFRSWLYTAALRKILARDRYHRAKKRDLDREVAAAGDEDHELRSVADCYAVLATPSQDLAARELMDRIDSAFAQLDPDHQQALSLSRIAGLPLDDVAREMNRSREACRKLIRRAQVKLALLLELDGDQGGY